MKRETSLHCLLLNCAIDVFLFYDYKVKNESIIHSCIPQLRIFASLFTPCSYATSSLVLDLSGISRSRGRNTSHGVDRHGFTLSAISTRGWKYSRRCLLSSAPRRRSRATPAWIVVIYGVDVAAIGRFRSVVDEYFERSGKIGRRKSARDRAEVVIRSE